MKSMVESTEEDTGQTQGTRSFMDLVLYWRAIAAQTGGGGDVETGGSNWTGGSKLVAATGGGKQLVAATGGGGKGKGKGW